MPQNIVETGVNPCSVCGSGPEPGYTASLCRSCRRDLSMRPFPLWVKGFCLLTLLLLAYSLVQLPSVVKANIAFERGQSAEKQKRFRTASREYGVAAEHFPDCTEILARQYISLFRAGRFEEASAIIEKIGGRKEENSALVGEVNRVSTRLTALTTPHPDFEKFAKDHEKDDRATIRSALRVYVSGHPYDVLATSALASLDFDAADYEDAEWCLSDVLTANPDHREGLLLLAAARRERKDYENALDLCRKVLDMDAEAIDAYAAMVRIELKRHRDPEALSIARKALALDPEAGEAQEALAMALHYNGLFRERDDVYRRFQANPSGYVVHEIPRTPGQSIWIGVGPFFLNTVVGAFIAAPSSIAAFQIPHDHLVVESRVDDLRPRHPEAFSADRTHGAS
ncbi:MAG: tetratricopeptide repeat protein [Acidobacteria bacterium]|nr:tetratricopeptide repeat protein [Acidobacteriota bacterium]